MSMMKCVDAEFELVRVSNESLQISDRVAMSVYPNLTSEHCTKTLPLQILLQIRIHIFSTQGISDSAPIVLLPDVLLRLLKRMSKFPCFTKATHRAALTCFAVYTLRILTARHLHISPVPVRVGIEVLLADLLSAILLPHSKFENESFPAHVVSTTGKKQRRGYSTTLDVLELRLQGIYSVYRANIGRDILGHFVCVILQLAYA